MKLTKKEWTPKQLEIKVEDGYWVSLWTKTGEVISLMFVKNGYVFYAKDPILYPDICEWFKISLVFLRKRHMEIFNEKYGESYIHFNTYDEVIAAYPMIKISKAPNDF